jgi:hypothetical protein
MMTDVPALSQEAFDECLSQAGLVLLPAERNRVLATARALERAVRIVDDYLGDAEPLPLPETSD